MKRKVYQIIAAAMLFVVLLTSCSTIDKITPPPTVVDSDISVSVEGFSVVSMPYPWMFLIPFTFVENDGLVVEIQNNSDSPIVINWDKSSISYGNDTSKVFLEGQKYITAGSSNPPLTLPIGAKKKIGVFPANNIEFTDDGWKIRGMDIGKDDEIILTLNYNANGTDHFVTISTTPKRAGFSFGV